jgi:hypothetical protein
MLAVAVAATSCTKKKNPAERTVAAPTAVQASFAAFADSVMPRVKQLLDSAGYHVVPDTSSATPGSMSAGDDRVLPLRPPDARAQVYEAIVILLFAHDDPQLGMSMPGSASLQFVSTGNAERWALLTTDGFLYDVLAGGRSRLPLDLQQAVRNQMTTKVDVGSWWGYVTDKLANPDSVLADSAWLTWTPSLNPRVPVRQKR